MGTGNLLFDESPLLKFSELVKNVFNWIFFLDVFAENNRLLRDRESSNQHRNDIVRMMQAQIDELEKNLKDAETKCQRLMDEWSSKESDFNQRIDSLEKDLNAKKDLLEVLLAPFYCEFTIRLLEILLVC